MVITPTHCVFKTRWQRGLLGLFVSLFFAVSASGAETVQSLRYGTTLYHFFQRDYYSALTELMAAEQLQQLGPHQARAELLRGGMSLSYGMDKAAARIFQELLGDTELRYPSDRDRAWFYLAKMAWQRGELQNSQLALDKMSSAYHGKFSGEANYFRSSIALRQGNEQNAIQYAGLLPLDSPWRYYLYYNLGAAQGVEGNWQQAIEYYSRFDEMSFPTAESKALHDKALSASGFAYMAADMFAQAREQFMRVRLDSPMSSRALLGYGWASSEMGDFPLALSSWQTLTGRSLTGASARESLLAIPYVYEKLGRSAIALGHYRRAANAYQVQLSTVRSTINEFKDGDLSELLDLGVGAPNVSTDAHGWVFGGDILPANSKAALLARALTGNDFQLASRELQDLYRIAWHMEDAQQRIQVLAQVDADQRASWSSVVEGDRKKQLQSRKHALEKTVAQLATRVESARKGGDKGSRLLANSAQTSRWKTLDHATGLAEKILDDANAEAKKSQLTLMRGLLLWGDSEQFVARSWTLQRDIKNLKVLIAQSTDLLERVDDAIAERAEMAFNQRIAAMRERMEPTGQRIKVAIGRSENQLRHVAISELKIQERDLSLALGRSRLAIARLYDESSQEAPL